MTDKLTERMARAIEAAHNKWSDAYDDMEEDLFETLARAAIEAMRDLGLLAELRSAFDGDDIARKNIALRKAYDALKLPEPPK